MRDFRNEELLPTLDSAELSKTIYEATKGLQDKSPYPNRKKEKKVFTALLQDLLSAPDLALPDTSKPFHFFVEQPKWCSLVV